MFSLKKKFILIIIFTLTVFISFSLFSGETASGDTNMIASVGIAILAATVIAFVSHLFKQPLLLAYIIAGVIIGPKLGFGFIEKAEDIETISHFGLILLLFLIGLEIDIKKLKSSGKSLVAGGLTQFPVCALLGSAFSASRVLCSRRRI